MRWYEAVPDRVWTIFFTVWIVLWNLFLKEDD